MRRSINCASAHQNGGFRWSEKTEPIQWHKCRLCLPGFACKLAASLVNGIKINVHPIIVFVLVFELRVNIALHIEVLFHRTQKGWI